jgi:penicillin-binding protein 2
MRQIGRGAAVVQDPNTGEILAMVSVPNYDPNDFVPSIPQSRFDAYNNNRAAPLTNRAISPFIPGSTFKLPTAIAGIIHNNVGFHNNCIGYSSFGAKLKIGCWKRGGHGTLGLSEAIQRSCNPYFMAMAGKIRSSAMVDTFNMLGFGVKSGILLPLEDEGIVPGSTIWKREIKPGAVLTPAELALMAIGQGDSMATPLQICSVTATIANGGRYYQPRIIRRVVGEDLAGNEEILKENIPIVKADLLKEGITELQLEVIRKGMWKAANEIGGTATKVAMKDVFIAAKTGTAQVSKTSTTHSHNAWTTSFAPYDSPRYAVTVVVANGKSGGKVAGALSHLIYRSIFNLEAGLKPPLGRLGIYEGNFEPFEEIVLPEGDLLALPISNQDDALDDVDLGNIQSGTPVKVKPKAIPLPSIAPLPDADTDEPSPAPGQ